MYFWLLIKVVVFCGFIIVFGFLFIFMHLMVSDGASRWDEGGDSSRLRSKKLERVPRNARGGFMFEMNNNLTMDDFHARAPIYESHVEIVSLHELKDG